MWPSFQTEGIILHVSLYEQQLPSASSTHTARDHGVTTIMLHVRQGRVILVVLTRVPPHTLDIQKACIFEPAH